MLDLNKIEIPANTAARVKHLRDAIKITVLKPEWDYRHQLVAEVTLRATKYVDFRPGSTDPNDINKLAEEDIKEFLLRSIYGNQRRELAELLRELETEVITNQYSGYYTDPRKLESILARLGELARFTLPNPVDKPT